MGRRKQTCTMLRTIFSRGYPFFSYMASRKKGSMSRIMQMAAVLTPGWALSRKNSGTPSAAPALKHTSCRFVRFSSTLVLTAFRSLGTGTYAILVYLRQ